MSVLYKNVETGQFFKQTKKNDQIALDDGYDIETDIYLKIENGDSISVSGAVNGSIWPEESWAEGHRVEIVDVNVRENK